jgi:hypothetical protein
MKKSKVIKIVLTGLAAVYGLAMTALMLHYRHEAQAERERAYHIADGMDHLLSLLGVSEEKLTVDNLRRRSDIIAVNPFPKHSQYFLRDGQRAYTVVFKDLEPMQGTRLNRYFSDIVLGNYYYIVISKNGRPVNFFWDKP